VVHAGSEPVAKLTGKTHRPVPWAATWLSEPSHGGELVECLPSWQVVVWFPTRRCLLESDGSYESDRASVVPQTGYDRLSSRRHDGLAVESENAHRSRDRLTGAGARLRAKGLRCLCVELRLRISSSMAIGLHTGVSGATAPGLVRRGAPRGGGAACRPESLPGWRAKGAVAVRSRG